MLELSNDAVKELAAYFEGKDRGTIRIFLAPGGCSGPRLALALDEPGDDDISEDANGFKFCINKQLLDEIKGAKIDVSSLGFVVEPEVPLPDTGSSGCGGCCGGCGSN